MICIETVPNVSEGRRASVLGACAAAITASGACLLDTHADDTHHRSVYSVAGTPETIAAAILALFDVALTTIDLCEHQGAHPRIGAVDVVPFVPLAGVSMAECVLLARRVGATVAERYDLPVFLYEHAASTAERRNLADIRRGGFETLSEKLRRPEWKPDFGPLRPHPTAGATAIGARGPLIAFNVNLATRRLDVARLIARTIRASAGGLPGLKAMAVDLVSRGLVQVSMNVTDFERCSLVDIHAAVTDLAAREGVSVLESELVGLAPAAVLSAAIAARIQLANFSENCILEERLRVCGIDLDGPIGMTPRR